MPVAQDLKKGATQVIDWGRATTMTRSFIQDGSKHWTLNQWQGNYVRIRGGANDSAIAVVRSNETSRLQLQEDLALMVEKPLESCYEILALQVNPATDLTVRLQALENKVEESNLILRQIREGIGSLVERDLSQVYPGT